MITYMWSGQVYFQLGTSNIGILIRMDKLKWIPKLYTERTSHVCFKILSEMLNWKLFWNWNMKF